VAIYSSLTLIPFVAIDLDFIIRRILSSTISHKMKIVERASKRVREVLSLQRNLYDSFIQYFIKCVIPPLVFCDHKIVYKIAIVRAHFEGIH
jgi:hypothetical protein